MTANIFHRNAEGIRERTQLCFRLSVSLNGWVYLGSPEKQNQQMMGMVINNKSESKNFCSWVRGENPKIVSLQGGGDAGDRTEHF